MEQENKTDLFGELSIDSTAQQHLRSIANWALVIVIVAVIGYVFTIIQMYTTPEVTKVKSEGFDLGSTMSGGEDKLWSKIYIAVMAVLQVFLFLFATQVRTGLDGLMQASLNKGLRNLKNYFIMASILCILLFFIFILVMVLLSTANPPQS